MDSFPDRSRGSADTTNVLLSLAALGMDPKRPLRQSLRRQSPFLEYPPDASSLRRLNQNMAPLQPGSSAPQSTYIYEQIAPNQIRLLYLMFKGEENDSLNCMIKVASLDDPSLRYGALSYNWDYEDATEELRIQQPGGRSPKDLLGCSLDTEYKSLYIQPNLMGALRYLRDYSREEPHDVVLWVHEVCIDQKSEDEKSIHVSKMADIYSHVENAFIWLGKAQDNSNIAMDFVSSILDLVTQDTVSVKDSSTGQWSAFMSLIRREWFSRRWVIQALALSRNAFLICGERVVNWRDFMVALEFFLESIENISALYSDAPEIKGKLLALGDIRALGAGRMLPVRKDFIRDSGGGRIEKLKSLESLVSKLDVFETADPRDTIYALMPLAYDIPGRLPLSSPWQRHALGEPVTFQADYQENILEVFKDFTAFCIHSSGSLNIICRKWAQNQREKKLSAMERCMYRGRRPPMEEVQLPSWVGLLKESAFGVPRAGPQTRVAGDSLVGTPDGKQYNASGGRKAEVLFGEDEVDPNSSKQNGRKLFTS
jgi:Heterokaryon incompatibility protein (HET)